MSTRIEHAPALEPVTVDEVAAELRLLDMSDEDRVLIGGHITAAREYGEKVTRRSLVYKGYVAAYDRFPSPGDYILLPNPPLVSVSEITYLDADLNSQTWDPAEYFVGTNQEPGFIRARAGFIFPVAARIRGAVEVHFYSGMGYGGYGDTERPILEILRLGIKKLAKHFYDNPESVSSEAQNTVPTNFTDLFRAHAYYPLPERW